MNENEENICQCGHEKEWHHPIAGTTCCIHEMPSIGHGVTLCGCSPFRPAPQGTPESNFMQVGRAIECGHCNPEKFGAGLKQAQEMMGEDFKCECVCHDPIPSWENDFYEVLPIICSPLTNDSKVSRIKTIFEKLLEAARKEERDEIVGLIKTLISMSDYDGEEKSEIYEDRIAKVLKQITSRNQE